MIPMYFGARSRRKYGVFHPSAGTGRRGRGLVICDAFGDEAIRAHRALRAAAESMADNRWNVLRFDYYGTGDSAGEHQQFSCAQAMRDIGEAVDELISMAGLADVYLLGLRLGGPLALNVATRRSDVAGLLLWDPIVDGEDYVEEWLGRSLRDAMGAQLGGFILGPSLQDELKGLRLDPGLAEFGQPVTMICTAATPAHRELARKYPQVDYREIGAPEAWTKDPDGGVRPLPSAVIQALTAWTG